MGGGTCARFDGMCESEDSIGGTDAEKGEPHAPDAGMWFDYQVKQLAKNAIFASEVSETEEDDEDKKNEQDKEDKKKDTKDKKDKKEKKEDKKEKKEDSKDKKEKGGKKKIVEKEED